MSGAPEIHAFFDEPTNAVSYVVADPASGAAAVIDPVLNFELASGEISSRSAEQILALASDRGHSIEWVLETHVHADHLSAADFIRQRTGAKVGIGQGVRAVQQAFAPRFGADEAEGSFDRLFADGDTIALGALTVEVLASPGHTPACVSYKIGNALFVGDTLFMPDYGTARTDFPGGDARQLYRSIRRILSFPRETRLFLCHDYKAPGRDAYAWETTVGDELDHNVHIGCGITEEEFIAMRQARDATLCAPKLLYPSIQVNLRGGQLPPAEANGERYMKIPLTVAESD
jgi:glyoxylase-like metal-dependent hydrolase (beta-lactamase superfamily II)